MYSSDQVAFQIVQTLSASISLTACYFVLAPLQNKPKLNLTDTLLAILICMDSGLSVLYGIGVAGTLNSGFCQFQAFLIQWFSLASVLWVASISFQLFKWLVLKKHADGIRKKLQRYLIGCVSVSGIIAISLLAAGSYGDANVWCWIDADNDVNEWLRFICFYFIVLIAWGFDLNKLHQVSESISGRVVKRKARRQSQASAGSAEEGHSIDLNFARQTLQAKLYQYMFIFVFIWGFGFLNRLVQISSGKPVFFLNFLTAMILPSQGLLNACCYGGLLDEDSYFMQCVEAVPWLAQLFAQAERVAEIAERVIERRISVKTLTTGEPKAEYKSKKMSIFSTTFNVGEAPVTDGIGEWILKGHDVYVIGVQECLDLDQLRESIHTHLGGASEYKMYKSEIGSNQTSLGFHGFIALTVLLKTSDVNNGYCRITSSSQSTVATGADLLITTAANKGAVGMPIQIHDTSFGVLTCHLPSDSKGVSKLPKRNASGIAILKELQLVSEDTGFDVHLQHDHLLFMGDMNYRMDAVGQGDGVSALTGVSLACSIEKSILDDDSQWLARRYKLLYGRNSGEYPNEGELAKLLEAKEAAIGSWNSVLRADELRRLMGDGEIFSGFDEMMPCFPPSYKRKKGVDGLLCGDYTDPVDMIGGFCNTGESEMLEDDDDDTSRPTSGSISLTPPSSPISRPRQASHSGNDEEIIAAREPGERVPSLKRRQKRVSVVMPLPANATKKEKKAIRPPSYTDRILVHSLPDRKDKIKMMAYDICDTVMVSDHRAISMVTELEVNANIKCSVDESPHSAPMDSKDPTDAPAGAFTLLGTSVEFLELIVRNLTVKFSSDDEWGSSNSNTSSKEVSNPMVSAVTSPVEAAAAVPSPSSPGGRPRMTSLKKQSSFFGRSSTIDEEDPASTDVSKVHEITVVFPLPSKDPLVNYRAMYDMTQALKVSSKGLLSSLQKQAVKAGVKGVKFTKENVLKPITVFPWAKACTGDIRVPGCIAPELGAHALLKLTDEDGNDLGECVVCLTHLLEQETQSAVHQMKIPLTSGGIVKGHVMGNFRLVPLAHSAAAAAAAGRSSVMSGRTSTLGRGSTGSTVSSTTGPPAGPKEDDFNL